MYRDIFTSFDISLRLAVAVDRKHPAILMAKPSHANIRDVYGVRWKEALQPAICSWKHKGPILGQTGVRLTVHMPLGKERICFPCTSTYNTRSILPGQTNRTSARSHNFVSRMKSITLRNPRHFDRGWKKKWGGISA